MNNLKKVGEGEIKTSKSNNEYMIIEINKERYLVFKDKTNSKKLVVFIDTKQHEQKTIDAGAFV